MTTTQFFPSCLTLIGCRWERDSELSFLGIPWFLGKQRASFLRNGQKKKKKKKHEKSKIISEFDWKKVRDFVAGNYKVGLEFNAIADFNHFVIVIISFHFRFISFFLEKMFD